MRALGIGAVLVLLAVSSDRLRSQVVTSSSSSAESILAALNDGRYADAERFAVAHLSDAQAAGDASHVARASDLLVEALTKNGKIADSRTVTLAERLISDKTEIFGPDSSELAASLDNLGTLFAARGEFSKAIASHEKALGIRRRLGASTEPAVADTLERLALPLIWLERFSDAQKYLDEATRLRKASPDTTPVALLRTSYLEALLHRWDGQYSSASSVLNQVLEARRALTPLHPDNVAVFELNGDLLFLRGAARQAEQAWSEALDLATQTLGERHPLTPPLYHRLAIAAQELGDLSRKKDLLERALDRVPGGMVPCYAELPALFNDFGTLSKYRGDFQEARQFLSQAYTISRSCLGPRHSLTTTIVYNQAAVAADMGDLARAEQLYRQAVQAWSQRLRPDHPFVANGLENLAGVASRRGRPVEASRLLQRALDLRTRSSGAESPNVASTLISLARIMVTNGELAGASAKVDQAIAIYERGNRPQSPDAVPTAHVLRGSLLFRQGDYERAREAFAKALGDRERVFGATHPVTAQARAELASADFRLGSVESALHGALEAEAIGRDHLRLTIRYLPERQALAYADKRPRGLDLALSAIASGASAQRGSVLDAVIRSRGVVLDEFGARAHSTAQSPDPVIATLNAEVGAARERFATLMMRSLTGDSPVSAANLNEAREKKESAERALAERSATERAAVAQSNLGLEDVHATLPAGAALVSFVRYERMAGAAAAHSSPPTASYIGFVIRSDTGAVDAVSLGPATTIENAVATWRAQLDGRAIAAGMPDAERAYRAAGAALRRRIWDPLEVALRGASQVFVVPDGAINLVSFAALPSATNRYLLDDGPLIHYLATERDLTTPASPTPGRGLLAVGGPAYGDRAQAVGATLALRAGCETSQGLRFEDLPGSRREAAEVAKIWSSRITQSSDTQVLSGRLATKTTVKRDAVGRRVIHLATHGFFLQSPCNSPIAGTRAVGGLARVAVSSPQVAENPLLLTGLAFAGANAGTNTRRDRRDDGILTAEEVAGMNLQGTEWVVLSACDTGTGQIKAGEGVFGLRRAFQIAGARTIIMSLWSVEDRSTEMWMRALYDARFTQQLSTAAAVRAASVAVLKERRARGTSTHPFFWAAFVAAGDWK